MDFPRWWIPSKQREPFRLLWSSSLLLLPPPPPPPSHALVSSLSTVDRKLVRRDIVYSIRNGFPLPLRSGEKEKERERESKRECKERACLELQSNLGRPPVYEKHAQLLHD